MHTDDPEEFNSGYLNSMMTQFAQGSAYTKAGMTRLMLNAYNAMWLPDSQKQKYIEALKNYAEEQGVDWKQ